MIKRFSVFLLWLLCWSLPAHADGLLASVDRTRLNSGESVELTLESRDATQLAGPGPTGQPVRSTRHPPGQPTDDPGR